jgi:hypothetical protein
VAVERWPHLGELASLVERPLEVEPDAPVKVQLFIDGDIVEAFVNGRGALACRVYDYQEGELGLFSEYSGADFRDLRIRGLP